MSVGKILPRFCDHCMCKQEADHRVCCTCGTRRPSERRAGGIPLTTTGVYPPLSQWPDLIRKVNERGD